MTQGSSIVGSTLVFGETVIDLVRKSRRTNSPELATFSAYTGGTGANVAVAMTRLGAVAALMSGVGADEWGILLRTWLEREGVDLRWFVEPPGAVTPVSLISLGPDKEPDIFMHCEALGHIADQCAIFYEEALDESRALYIASNTLVGAAERRLTLALRRRALDRGLPVCIDINLRAGRWPSLSQAASLCRSIIHKATLVKCNRAEAEWITGLADPSAAAAALIALGADQVVVTLGSEGALVVGAATTMIPSIRVRPRSTLGAGDALIATVMARLAISGWETTALPDAVREGVAAAGHVTEVWGAVN